MTALSLKNIDKNFDDIQVIRNINLDIQPGEFVVFVGPSGCGKSTLLRMVAGLEEISSGEFWIGDRRADQLPASERDIAMVFQSYALYPHMTLAENIGFPLRLGKQPKEIIDKKVQDIASILRLEQLLDRKPGQISGGQRQRVAIGRALARDPKVILLDEPLSNLDAALRLEMRIELAKLHKQLEATMIYVTHDQVEAMTLADRIVILNNGEIVQIGSPLDLYTKPVNTFVAEFIGSPKMNLFPAMVADNLTNGTKINLIGSSDKLMINTAVNSNQGLQLGIRPEHMTPSNEGAIKGIVTSAEQLGSDTYIYFNSEAKDQAVARLDGISAVRTGENISFNASQDHYHLFTSEGNRIN
ncbi:ABC transporter ATP-binding protein [Kiloniella sp. EL199]|uniref:ABC transporter ATP-binding protein n=1 Tax=Kiloniella sp. EL199 TaxID=2107581 RepID=UPI000EA310E0|nr:ABC transporter ATP-binding protein [Kiloniella sp. EL199]